MDLPNSIPATTADRPAGGLVTGAIGRRRRRRAERVGQVEHFHSALARRERGERAPSAVITGTVASSTGWPIQRTEAGIQRVGERREGGVYFHRTDLC